MDEHPGTSRRRRRMRQERLSRLRQKAPGLDSVSS